MRVQDPSGRTWTVSRQLIRLPRWGGFGRPQFGATDGVVASSGGGGLGDLALGIVVVGTLVLSVAFVWPLIVFLVELLAAAVLVGVRFFLGRWTVVAETVGERNAWPIRGRRRAVSFAAEVADSLQTGRGLPAGGSFISKAPVLAAEAELAKPASSGHVRVIKP